MNADLVLEQLRAVRNDVADLKAETRSGFHTLSERMSALETHMVGVLKQLPPVWDELAALKKRIEHIEHRLEIAD